MRSGTPMSGILTILAGDITTQAVDAIVNAANSSLLGGGGVDGAIHRKAGPALADACRQLGRCATGDAKLTPGFNLPAKWVIHTVGPVWQDGAHQEAELLAQCYRRCFAIAAQQSFATLALPSISTGRYRFPLEQAATIALQEIRDALNQNTILQEVRVVCFETSVYETYRRLAASQDHTTADQ